MLADWTASEEYEDIRELQTNNIALQDSLKGTEKELGKITLSLESSESLVKRLTQQFRDLQDTASVFAGSDPETCQQ